MAKASPAAPPLAAAALTLQEVVARDTIIAWYRGEFAAANAIIDVLCSHLEQIAGPSSHRYEQAFCAIRRRRMNWIPALHMQKYFSIGEVVVEFRRVAAGCHEEATEEPLKRSEPLLEETLRDPPKVLEPGGSGGMVEASLCQDEQLLVEDTQSPCQDGHSSMEDTQSPCQDEHSFEEDVQSPHQEEQSSITNIRICSDHESCNVRTGRITIRKGFAAKESVKGHMVNVVKGLKLYEDIFQECELAKLADLISGLRAAARNGQLRGETFIFFNKQLKGNKREIIQLGVPVFQSTKDEESSHIEPIPPMLQDVIDHLIQWRLIPESRKPNSCIINFFDEDEYSQPYFKPPHLDNPISVLLLYEATMAFGRSLVSDHGGNYKGSLNLSLKEGSLLVMRGNSADVARHVVCPSPSLRVSIAFLRVRTPSIQPVSSPTSSTLTIPSKTITLFKPQKLQKHAPGEDAISKLVCGPQCTAPTWTVALAPPILMLPPRCATVSLREKTPRAGGTGVFLPLTVGPKKYVKHLPPRIQRQRILSLEGSLEVEVEKHGQIPCIVV